MTALLEVRGLHAGYGAIQVLRGIEFSVREGCVTALLGANGAGKTTTLRALSGTIKRNGTLRFEGRSMVDMATAEIVRLGIAHVPDGRGTFMRQTVAENLQLGAMTRRDFSAIETDIEKVYGYFPILKQRSTQMAGLLSGGEQQMLAVGRALMLRPRLLLLDEPSFGLAPLIVDEIFEIFRRLKQEERVSILIVEQNAMKALDLADDAYVLESGSVALSGPAASIRSDESVRRAYLGY